MGRPSATEPWGWQFSGHHAIVNFFVLGDQVVMTPVFLGSEPVRATSGKYKGLVVLQQEQKDGLDMVRALRAAQQQKSGSELLQDRKQQSNGGVQGQRGARLCRYPRKGLGIQAAVLTRSENFGL